MQDDENEAWDEGLKHKDRLFVLQYCAVAETFLNASASYRAVYTKTDKESGEKIVPEQTTCESNGSKKVKQLRTAIKKLLKLVQADLDEENAYRVIHDMAEIALFNPADVINSKGELKAPLEELGSKAKCIAQIIPCEKGVRVVMADRTKYMDMLAKYLNLVRPETQIDVKLPVVELAPKVTGDVLDAVEKWNKQAEDESK